jgi:WD40 repeat-containing protein SMU1
MEKGHLNPMDGVGNAFVQSIIQLPKNMDQYLVCNKTDTLFIISSRGQIIKAMTHKKQAESDFIAAATSPQGNFIYGITETEDLFMYGFQLSTGNQVGKVKISENEVIGMISHPLPNVVKAP